MDNSLSSFENTFFGGFPSTNRVLKYSWVISVNSETSFRSRSGIVIFDVTKVFTSFTLLSFFEPEKTKKLDIYNHTKIESDWPETLGIINAYDLNKGDSKNFGILENVEITLCDKSEG